MAQLIIHAGFPKCGSSTIFQGMAKNLANLNSQDIYLFNRNLDLPEQRNRLQSPIWTLNNAMGNPQKIGEIRSKIETSLKSRAPEKRLLISSEILANKRLAKKFFEDLAIPHGAQIVFYVRPQTDWIPSAWKQWEMKEGRDISSSLKSYIEEGRPPYLSSIRLWKKILPSAKFSVRLFSREALVDKNPLLDFLNVIGADCKDIDPTSDVTNPSIDYSLLHFFMINYDTFFRHKHHNKYLNKITKLLPSELLKSNAPMLTESQLDFISDHYLPENQKLVEEYINPSNGPDNALEYFTKHKPMTGVAYSDMKEADILARARSIFQETLHINSSQEHLAEDVKTYLDSIPDDS